MTECRHCRYSFAGVHGLYCGLLDKHPTEPCANFEREPGSDDDKGEPPCAE